MQLKNKRIIIVLSNFELGGAEHQALLLGRYLLHEQGAKVQFWGFDTPGPAIEICERYEIPWRIIPLKFCHKSILASALLLGWWLWRDKPDVILPYLTTCNVKCGLIWRWTGAQLCIWNQRNGGTDPIGTSILTRWAMHLTPWFISNSQPGADFLIQKWAVKTDRITVIHNGTPLNTCQSKRTIWCTQLKISKDCFLVCMVANLSIYKDHVTLLRAWRQVIDQLEHVHTPILLLAGQFWETYASLKSLTHELKLTQNVRFLGQVKDVSGLLGSVDLGVFSSRSEGKPNGVLECMAAGLAVAGTDIPGIREAVGTKGEAFLAPIGDADALANRILTLMRNHKLRVQMGTANRQRVETEFSLERMCDATVKFIVQKLERV